MKLKAASLFLLFFFFVYLFLHRIQMCSSHHGATYFSVVKTLDEKSILPEAKTGPWTGANPA